MAATENTSLLEQSRINKLAHRTIERLNRPYLPDDELKLGEVYAGERLPYTDYSSIDFLSDLVCCHQRVPWCRGLMRIRPKSRHEHVQSTVSQVCELEFMACSTTHRTGS